MPEFNETPDQFRREVRFAQHFAKPSADPIEVPIRGTFWIIWICIRRI